MNYWKHIDDFFREKLGRYRETPPPDVWEALDKQLDGLIPAPTAPSAPRPSFRWLGHVAMVSLVAVLSIPLVKKMVASKTPGGNNTAIEAPVVANAPGPAVADANAAAENEQPKSGESTGASSPAPGHKPVAEANAAQAAAGDAKTPPEANKSWVKNTNRKTATTSGHTGKTNKEHNRQKPVVQTNNYNSSTANTGSSMPAKEKETAAITKQVQPAPKTPKKEGVKKTAAKKPEPIPPAPVFSRLEAGLKAGYERGPNNDAATKYTVSPYVQYNLSSKFALMVQPGVKYAQLSTRNVGNDQAYSMAKAGGTTTQDGSPVIGASRGTETYTTTYTYTHANDMILKSYKTGGAYAEYELPVLLKYNIIKTVSMYGGVNFIYHKLPGLTAGTSAKAGDSSSVNFVDVTNGQPGGITPGPQSNYYTGITSSDYKIIAYPSPKGALNIGYMLGVSYEYSNRWLFDALLEQSPANKNIEGGYNINAPSSAAYLRLSVGYKFIK